MARRYAAGPRESRIDTFVQSSCAIVQDDCTVVSVPHRRTRRETPSLLKGMWEAQDLYFDTLSQIRMDRWSTGRIALLGDAAWCAGPGGSGTGMAMMGAHVLAGELAAAGGDHTAAFAAYERILRPAVKIGQKQGKGSGGFLAPVDDKKIAQPQQGLQDADAQDGRRLLPSAHGSRGQRGGVQGVPDGGTRSRRGRGNESHRGLKTDCAPADRSAEDPLAPTDRLASDVEPAHRVRVRMSTVAIRRSAVTRRRPRQRPGQGAVPHITSQNESAGIPTPRFPKTPRPGPYCCGCSTVRARMLAVRAGAGSSRPSSAGAPTAGGAVLAESGFCRRGDEPRLRDRHAPPGDTPDRVDRMKRAKYDRLRGTHRLWNAANPVVTVGPQPLRRRAR